MASKYVRFNLPNGVIAFVPAQGYRSPEKDGGAAFVLKRSMWNMFRFMPLMKYVDPDFMPNADPEPKEVAVDGTHEEVIDLLEEADDD